MKLVYKKTIIDELNELIDSAEGNIDYIEVSESDYSTIYHDQNSRREILWAENLLSAGKLSSLIYFYKGDSYSIRLKNN